jgi:ATP-dependent DNA helicase RecG
LFQSSLTLARDIHGGKPQFMEQDIFRIALDYTDETKGENATIKCADATINATVNDVEYDILKLIEQNPTITYTELSEILNQHRATIAWHIKSLAERKIIARSGAKKNGTWKIEIPFVKSSIIQK